MSQASSGKFKPGDRVQLTGPKGKMNTITLVNGASFGTHRGNIRHDDIIGKLSGSVIRNSSGVEYLALKPLLTDYVLSMPRGAAIVYPKDAAQIIVHGDIFPGAKVVEAGVGSGALSIFLLRAIGPKGELHSFERREEFAEIAKGNVRGHFGANPTNWTVNIGDLQVQLPRALKSASVDRVVLDMLAPWECIDASAKVLKPGGLIISYVATVTQLSRTVEEIRATGEFTEPEAFENLIRSWHLQGLAVRPEHRMIGHTGFLVFARRIAPGEVLPKFRRAAKNTEYAEADVSAWTANALGEKPVSEKKLRKTVKRATKASG